MWVWWQRAFLCWTVRYTVLRTTKSGNLPTRVSRWLVVILVGTVSILWTTSVSNERCCWGVPFKTDNYRSSKTTSNVWLMWRNMSFRGMQWWVKQWLATILTADDVYVWWEVNSLLLMSREIYYRYEDFVKKWNLKRYWRLHYANYKCANSKSLKKWIPL